MTGVSGSIDKGNALYWLLLTASSIGAFFYLKETNFISWRMRCWRFFM